VEETFRFVCPNNPVVRGKVVRRLRELLARYAFGGVFLDKIRLPSPANGVDEMLSCFCDHCRAAAASVDLDLDAVVKILADRAIDPRASTETTGNGASWWLDALLAGNDILSRFLRFRAESVAALVAELSEQARRMGRRVSLDLFSPCLAFLVGQDYRRLKQYCDWAKPMTYRLAQGPAGLRLEIPALIEGVANRFGLDEARIVEWSARARLFWQRRAPRNPGAGGPDLVHPGGDRRGCSDARPGPGLFRTGTRPAARRHRRRFGARCRHGDSRPRGERSRARDLMGSGACAG
jgi:hypothetical protein